MGCGACGGFQELAGLRDVLSASAAGQKAARRRSSRWRSSPSSGGTFYKVGIGYIDFLLPQLSAI